MLANSELAGSGVLTTRTELCRFGSRWYRHSRIGPSEGSITWHHLRSYHAGRIGNCAFCRWPNQMIRLDRSTLESLPRSLHPLFNFSGEAQTNELESRPNELLSILVASGASGCW